MKPQLKLMVDYQCWPLWLKERAREVTENIDPSTLPLSRDTITALEKWADIFDSWLNLDDPAASGEASPEEFEAFEKEGVRLWRQLITELPEYEVSYMGRSSTIVYTDPDQLPPRLRD